MVQQYDINADSFYQALYQILPQASIFALVPLPESESEPPTGTLSARPNPPDHACMQ